MKKWMVALAMMSIGMFSVFPATQASADPAAVHSETLVLDADGEQIEGVLYLPDDATESYPTVILCHGFGGNYHFLTGRIAQELARNGYVAYAFNFRNPDTRSMLNTSPLTEAKTLNIVIDQIKQQPFVDQSRLFLLGESQGGFVSAYVAAKRAETLDDIKALILYYPAFVLQDDARARNPQYQEEGYTYPETEIVGGNQISGMYSRDALSFDIYDVIPAYQHDVLIIHGTSDTVVPLSYSERALEVYPHAELKIIQNAGHGFYGGSDFDTAVRETVAFLNDHKEDADDKTTIPTEEKPMIQVTIHDETFLASLENNETAEAYAALLPMRLNMEELNGNEIYHYLLGPLPSAPQRVGHVDAGDIMLFGDSCVVIFFESFDTPYSYTRIGHIDDAARLNAAIGGQDAAVTFEKTED